MIEKIGHLKVKIFADCAENKEILTLARMPYIKGLTTNPSLLRQAQVNDFQEFAKELVAAIPNKPISFGVLADEWSEMEQQALKIASWGSNVYVKIPVMNTRRESCLPLLERLAAQGVKLNVTAIMTLEQVKLVTKALSFEVPSFVSVFAGRIADTGLDPVPLMAEALAILDSNPNAELIWASPRELFNIFQANSIGCHIITVTKEILKKLTLVGYNLEEYSLDTVKMFHKDAQLAGLKVPL